MSGESKIPKVFISYSWDSEEHKNWVRKLSEQLRQEGIDVILDQWHVFPGDPLHEFMERAIRESDFVLLICTPGFKTKSDKRLGGVGYEGNVITGEVFHQYNHRKFIPLLRHDKWPDAAPGWVQSRVYLDLTERFYNENFDELVRTLHGERNLPPPLGTRSKGNAKKEVFHQSESSAAFPIQFRASQSSFQPAKRPSDREWIDTSFSQSPYAVGELRLPSVRNGRYGSKHPILDEDGNTVGFLLDGEDSLGYTFTCVYAGGCFWITHQGFSEVLNRVNISSVSLVDRTGTFIFSTGVRKFKVVKFFEFGGSWVDTIRTFKLLDDETCLLYLTNYGFCLFDTRTREIIAKAEFTDFAYQWFGFALSPKVKLLAIGCSVRGDKDLLDGEDRYKNFVRIYNLEAGVAVGEQHLPADQNTQWAVDFSEDGRQVRAKSESSEYVFDLIVSRQP